MKILVTGANGQLGSEIKGLAELYSNLEFVFAGRSELDICNKANVFEFVSKNQIDGIINCAAYTAVDKAETHYKAAELVNATAVGNLVSVAEEQNLKLIHISTDCVFDGNGHIPYVEDFEVSPIGVYGKTKRFGEEYVLNSESESIIIRTSWLYSIFGHNFMKTMLLLGNQRDEIGVVFDQVGTPTYARDLAQTCLGILSRKEKINGKGKLYHYSNEGAVSWYDFSKAIMEMGKVDCRVNPIETKDYPTLARRPAYSVMDKSKIKDDFGIEIPYWRDSLKECILRLKSKG
ncbi:dTDP-4-dehydrorhamnose reductase [Ancylomarina sp. 16SWW S1-10-2]|uniref:dTDP-4-dehydrorhamnose reductase n=1 Tax=Ancylomarina sp. 16SWW S1-10-2 TaxID=2499681 RepID=UPI0012AE0D82|nr:dTDP-4-dehydrorhamnose reductase [Ancylomarina sp. 16SWW S1-10-2]MRT94276.1 dTDP-4-dehydrorhamnose reductase [Ancylomarina sp. 16SWW S1-10-2]